MPAALCTSSRRPRTDWVRGLAPATIGYTISGRGFLADEDAPWVDQRKWLEDVHLRSLECDGIASLGIGGSAERDARRLVRLAPYRESGYRLLMPALEHKGDNAVAGTPPPPAGRRGLRNVLHEVDALGALLERSWNGSGGNQRQLAAGYQHRSATGSYLTGLIAPPKTSCLVTAGSGAYTSIWCG